MPYITRSAFTNDSHLVSILLTPEEFLNFYNNIYNSDIEVAKIKKMGFVLTSIFLALGIVYNIASIYAFFQKKLRDHKFNFYLLVASIFKLIFCTSLFIDYLFSKCYKEPIFLHQLNETFAKVIDFILLTTDSSISYLTVFVTLDRLHAIKNPMLKSEFITNLHAKCLTIVSLSILTFLKILSFLICEFQIVSKSQIIFCTVLAHTIFNIVPLLVILTVNTLLVLEVLKYYRNQSKNSYDFSTYDQSIEQTQIELKHLNSTKNSVIIKQANKIGKKLTRSQKSHYIIIITTDIWSVLTSLPYYSLNSYFILFQLNFFNIETIIMLQIISSVFFNTNHSISFFIYLCFNEDFREVILKLLLKLRVKKHVI